MPAISEVLIKEPSAPFALNGKDKAPLVSVVTPTYNRKERLGRAIESALRQTYKNYEIVVVDDGSTDGTAAWLKASYPQIRLIALEKNKGVAGARTVGIQAAKGELVAFLDSDDEWLPEYLAFQIEALRRTPEASLSFCGCFITHPDGRREEAGYIEKPEYSSLLHRLLLEISFIKTPSVTVCRRSVFEKIGPYDERFHTTDDREFYTRLVTLGDPLVFIPKNLAIKHRGEDSISWNPLPWGKDTMQLLDIFYTRPESASFRDMEPLARRKVCIKLSRSFIYTKMPFVKKFLLFWKVLFFCGRYGQFPAPNDVSDLIVMRFKRLWGRLTGKKTGSRSA